MVQRYVSISFPYLATDWFCLRRPELKAKPFVLSTPVHGRMVISAANLIARSRGIETGMAVADARAIFPAVTVLDDKPQLKEQLLQRLAEWCIRFTPVAGVDPDGGILLDATGCAHLWGGEENYITDICKRLSERGYFCRVAIADTIGVAWAQARFGQASIIKNGEHADAIKPLPPEALRLEDFTVERFHKLGLHRVQDFIGMPPSALRRRFGSLVIQRLNQALGKEQEFIHPFFPVTPYQEWLPCPDPIVHAEGIETALHRMLDGLCIRLQKEGKGIRSAYFRGYRNDHKTAGIQISTSGPSSDQQHLFHLFQMKLPDFEPSTGIELFLLEATTIEDQTEHQESFWKEGKGMNDKAISQLIDRLTGKIGSPAISRYLPDEHHWPERSMKKASSLTELSTTSWSREKRRPLLLLRVPQRIEVAAPIPDYPPMHFRYQGNLHRIIRADGPERIEQEWWIQEGQHRDYFAVEDENGGRYWLFRSGYYDPDNKSQWYLHGYFP